MKLFLLHPDNRYKMPLLVNQTEYVLLADWGRRSLRQTWYLMQYMMGAPGEKTKKGFGLIPDVCKCTGGGVAFRPNLVHDIFPEKSDDIELLPILIDGEDWLFVNCLRTTIDYDAGKSKFMRSIEESNQIFLINHIVLNNSALVKDAELFTLEDSNRAWIIATESFVDRIRRLQLKGLEFREIGCIKGVDP